MEIAPGVHIVPGTRLSRIYLIEDKDALTLIDAGLPGSARRVFEYIERIGRRREELARILMTHNHPDHAGGAPKICAGGKAQVSAHPHDAPARRAGERSLAYMGAFNALDLPLPFLRRVSVSRLIGDGDVIPVAGGMRVIHTPGHTPGSVCFLLQEQSLLFSGDTIFSDGRRVSRSIPFPGSDAAQYRQSLERLAGMRFDILCGGHGAPLLGGASDMLQALLERKPRPPNWGEFMFKRLPRRLIARKWWSAEDY